MEYGSRRGQHAYYSGIGRLAKARSLTLTTVHVVAGAVFIALLVVGLSLGLFWMTVRHAAEIKLPLLDSLVLSAQEQQRRKTEEFLRENLNAMAVKLGQMQAQLMRLDALGERLSALGGIKPQEFRFNELPGRGGAVSSVPAKDLSMARPPCPASRRRIFPWPSSTGSSTSFPGRWTTAATTSASSNPSCSTPR